MGWIRKWRRKGPQVEITVCWLEEGISFARWEPAGGRVRICSGSAFLRKVEADAAGYRKQFAKLAGALEARALTVRWSVLEEAFPGNGHGCNPEPGTLPGLPEWIRQCWRTLAVREIPGIVFSGMETLAKEFDRSSDGRDGGTGYCLPLGKRILFIGKGNGRRFHRISRKGLGSGEDPLLVSREWLLQTRLLFKNRTASPLCRVYVPEGGDRLLSFAGEDPIEIIPGLKPPAWVSAKDCRLDSGTLYLHLGLLRVGPDSRSQLVLPQLAKRRRRLEWDRRLRMGSCLLLGGWSFLLLGACRQNVTASPDGAEEASLSRLRAEAYTLESRWRSGRALERERHGLYWLVGSISGSVPQGIEVNRIRISERAKGDRGQPGFQVEGTFREENKSEEFRLWIDSLKKKTGIGKVTNLRFDRSGKRILFSLQGTTEIGEGRL